MSGNLAVDASAVPTGPGCLECTEQDGWWLHLRRCAACGHIGCCDTSPSQHATKHYQQTGHHIMQSFEPGEDWFWDFSTEQSYIGPMLPEPTHHPLDQSVPGPAERVPADWQQHLN